MADLAQLGLEVETKGFDEAQSKAENLQSTLKDTAKTADDFNERMSGGAEKVGQSYTSNAQRIAAASAQQSGAWGAVQSAVGSVSAETLGLITVLGTAAVAIGAAAIYAAVSWNNSQGEIEKALTGIGQRSGATVSDINRIAYASASATGLSVDQARGVATELAKTGNISVNSIQGITQATQGFSLMIGKDATTAGKDLAKIMGGDLVTAATKLNETYGTIDGKTIEYVRTLQNQGEKQQAIQLILDKLEPTNQRAVESLGTLERAWAAVGNAVSATKNAIGGIGAPAPLQQQIDVKQADVNRLQSNQFTMGADMQTLSGGPGSDNSAAYEKEAAALRDLKAAQDALQADALDKKFIAEAASADAATKAIIPQIAQIQNLEKELAKLKIAQDSPDVQGRMGMSLDQIEAANQAGENQKKILQETAAEAVAYNQHVKEIADSYDGVSTKAALTHDMMEKQLPVIQAIGAEAKRQVQYQVDINTEFEKTGNMQQAILAAQDRYNASQAASIANAQQGTDALKQQNDLAAAGLVTTQSTSAVRRAEDQLAAVQRQKALAESQAYDKVLKDTGDTQEAINRSQAVSDSYQGKILAAQNRINDAKKKQHEADLAWQADMLGVSDTAKQITAQAQATADAYQAAANAATRLVYKAGPPANGDWGGGTSPNGGDVAFGGFDVPKGAQSTIVGNPVSLGFGGTIPASLMDASNQAAAVALASGGIDAAIRSAMQGGVAWPGQKQIGPSFATAGAPDMNTIMTLFDLKNAQTNDNGVKQANLQEEMAWLQTQPETIARDQVIVQLQQSIDTLKATVAANTAALASTTTNKTVIYVQPGVTSDQFIRSRAQIQRAVGA